MEEQYFMQRSYQYQILNIRATVEAQSQREKQLQQIYRRVQPSLPRTEADKIFLALSAEALELIEDYRSYTKEMGEIEEAIKDAINTPGMVMAFFNSLALPGSEILIGKRRYSVNHVRHHFLENRLEWEFCLSREPANLSVYVGPTVKIPQIGS